MYILEVEKRDKNVKAKKIRKSGLVPCNVYGGKLSETLLFTIPQGEARKLLKEKSEGGIVTLKCNEEKVNALIKSISSSIINNQIEDISFESLDNNTSLNSVAKIVLKNKDKVPTLVQLLLPEIPYKALPKHIIETIEIDLAELRPGDQVKVEDLSISKDPDIEVMIEKDRMVLNLVENAGPKKIEEDE